MDNELKRPEIIRVPFKELEDKGYAPYGGDLYYYKGKPFKGFCVWDYYPNGNIMFEEEFAEGILTGWGVEYYENGKKKYETLNYGFTSVIYNKFDEDGIITEGGWVAAKEYYNKVAKLTGMDPIDL